MLLCLLVYRLAEHRLRERLAATGQIVPNQLKQPTERPTMRWIFQCFEGISLVRFLAPLGPPSHEIVEIVGLEPLHHQVIRLLGPDCEKLYELGVWGCGMLSMLWSGGGEDYPACVEQAGTSRGVRGVRAPRAHIGTGIPKPVGMFEGPSASLN
jgi:hypothetical protein